VVLFFLAKPFQNTLRQIIYVPFADISFQHITSFNAVIVIQL